MTRTHGPLASPLLLLLLVAPMALMLAGRGAQAKPQQDIAKFAEWLKQKALLLLFPQNYNVRCIRMSRSARCKYATWDEDTAAAACLRPRTSRCAFVDAVLCHLKIPTKTREEHA